MERVCKLREGRLQACPPWSEHSGRGHAQTFVSSRQTFVASLTDYEITASSKSDISCRPRLFSIFALCSGRDSTRTGASLNTLAPQCRVGMRAAVLRCGEASVYDRRLLHAGGRNASDGARVQFYVTFARVDVEGADVWNAYSIRTEYRDTMRLARFRDV